MTIPLYKVRDDRLSEAAVAIKLKSSHNIMFEDKVFPIH